MQILPKTNPSETKVTNTGVSKPPQIGGCTVSRSSGLENNFFYFQNHFLKIHAQRIPKMSDFYVFSHFWPRKWLLKLKKRVLTPSFSHLTFSSQMGTPSKQWLASPFRQGSCWYLGRNQKYIICRDSFNLSHGTFLYFSCNENMAIKCGGQSYSVPNG